MSTYNLQSRRHLVQVSIIAFTFIMLGLSIGVWASQLGNTVTIYTVFPILGLCAFVLMAMHYVSGGVKQYAGLADDSALLQRYFTITSYIVLVFILLHPALLYIGLYYDGLGLPPLSSFMAYPTTVGRIALVMGAVSLTAFLLFELHRWFKNRPWWKYIEYFNLVAMALIFVHSLLLGSQLMNGWFRFVWIGFGAMVAGSIMYGYAKNKPRTAQ